MKDNVLDLLDSYFDSELDFEGQSLVTRRIIEGDPLVIQKIEELRLIRSELNSWSQQHNACKTNFWEKIERDICKIASQQKKANFFEKFIGSILEELRYLTSKPIPFGLAATAALFVFALTHGFHTYYKNKDSLEVVNNSFNNVSSDNIKFVSSSSQFANNGDLSDQLILKDSTTDSRLDQDLSMETMFKKPELKPLSIKLLSPEDAFTNNDIITENDPIRFALIDNQRPLKLNFAGVNRSQLQTKYNFVNLK